MSAMAKREACLEMKAAKASEAGASFLFAIGVVSALTLASQLVHRGVMKFDHPVFEHYGEVITGLGIALVGSILFSVQW